MTISVNLLKVKSNGTLSCQFDYVTTNSKGWFISKSTGCVALTLEKLSDSISQRTGRYMMISAHP